jgi:hypothetical protein
MRLEFEPIQLEKQNDFINQLALCPRVTSDYSFVNLWGWAEVYGLCWCWRDDLVWIKQTKPREKYWAPIGPWEKIDWQAVLAESLPPGAPFTRIPEPLLKIWQKAKGDSLKMEEARGHWDYVYDVSALAALKGNKYHKKKNLLNQFKKKYEYTYMPFEPEIIDCAKEMQADWCAWRECEFSEALIDENRAIEKVLNAWNQLTHLLGGAIIVEGTMVAYTVGEQLTKDMLVIHFEKGDPRLKGVYQAINQMFLESLHDTYPLVNREQDLGDDGLRKSKLSYNPVTFLKKYRVIL